MVTKQIYRKSPVFTANFYRGLIYFTVESSVKFFNFSVKKV